LQTNWRTLMNINATAIATKEDKYQM